MFLIKLFKFLYLSFNGLKKFVFLVRNSNSNNLLNNKQVIFIDLNDRSLEHYYPCFFMQLIESDFHLIFNKYNFKFNGLDEGSFKKFWETKNYEFSSFNYSFLNYPSLYYLSDDSNLIEAKKKAKLKIKIIHIKFNYFNSNNSNLTIKNFFPMSKHPSFYFETLFKNQHEINLDILSNNNNKKFKIIFSGNVDPNSYNREHLNIFFKINTRYQIIKYLENNFPKVYKYDKVNYNNPFYFNYWGSNTGILSCQDGVLGINEWVALLNNANFILALPGCQMPHCWSLIEALSFGVIPIIQKGYADLMIPNLENLINCIIFDDLEDLVTVCLNVLNLSEKEIFVMSENVKSYYNSYYSPNYINKLIASLNCEYNELIINAETKSLLLMINNSNYSESQKSQFLKSIYTDTIVNYEVH